MLKISQKVKKELKILASDQKNIKDYSRFHKDGRKHISLATPVVRKLSAQMFKEVKYLEKKEIFKICEELLNYEDTSCRDIAFDWAFRMKKEYEKTDFKVFHNWLDKYVDTWGSCDDFCSHALGYLLFDFPEIIPDIYKWTKSQNMWRRRASAVIFIYSARRGKYLKDVLKIAEILLLDKEDLIQKGYGWMLKEASNVHEKEVFDFVMKHNKIMPRTALRYAIEKMPQDLKKIVMNK